MEQMSLRENKVEILAPAGSYDILMADFAAGADAVYLGGAMFGARAYANNLSQEELLRALDYAHLHDKKIYLTVNTLMKQQELEDRLLPYLEPFYKAGLSAVIVQDFGAFEAIKEAFPGLHIHASTQMTVTGAAGAKLLKEAGASRVVTARELSLREIRQIREHISDDLEIETFVHGAMCISYSGRCLLSNYFTGRDANRGACTHPCRWKYSVVEEKRPGEYFPVYENERGTYIFNSKDLCMIEHIPDLLEAGIDSFKIEGRMKTALYVATVARTYRKAIDDYLESPEKYQENMPWYLEQIKSCTYRQFTTGFFYGKPSEETQIYDNNTYEKGYTYLGIVGPKNEKGMYRVEQKNKFSVGEQIEVMKPDGRNMTVTVRGLMDEKGEPMESCPHPQQIFYVDLGMEPDEYDILRRREEEAIALD